MRRAHLVVRRVRVRSDHQEAIRTKHDYTYLRRDRGVRHHVENVAHLPLRPRWQRRRVERIQGERRDGSQHQPGHNIKRRQERHRPVVYEVSRRARESSRFAAETAEGIYVGWVMPQRLQQLLEGCIVRIAPAVIVGAAWRYLGSTAWLPEHCVCKGLPFCRGSALQRLRWMLR